MVTPSTFDFSRAFAGWWWLLRRDVPRLMPLLLVWWGIDFGHSALEYGMGTTSTLGLLLVSFVIDPFFVGVFYVFALSEQGRSTMSVFREVLARYRGLVAIYLLTSLGAGAGLVLLILPGIALAVLWLVALPVFLVERKKVFQSIKASFGYVRPHFWPILGMCLLYVGVIGILLVAAIFAGWADYESTGLIMIGAESIVALFMSFVGVYLGAAVYRELTYSGHALVDVFD